MTRTLDRGSCADEEDLLIFLMVINLKYAQA